MEQKKKMSQKTKHIQFDDQEKAEEILRLFSDLNTRDKGKVLGELSTNPSGGTRDMEVSL